MRSARTKPGKGTPRQEDYYSRVEADAYFRRNLPAMRQQDPDGKHGRQAVMGKVRLIELAHRVGLKPRTAVDIGGSSGYFIAAFQKEFSCKATLIEPSGEAIAYATQHYPDVTAVRGVASKLPLEDASMDVVIAKGVFCWIGREALLKAVAEIDRVLVDGGHLLISDFHPDAPRKTANRHAPGEGIYCFKTDHSRIFLDSGLYTTVASEVYVDENDSLPGGDLYDVRHQNLVLRKSYLDYYASRS